METLNKTFTNEVLEPITKRILVNLVEQMSSKSLNKGLPLGVFYDLHPDLYKNPKSKRKASYKRKRVLIITSIPMNKGLVDTALANINDKYKKRGIFISPDQIEVICSKDRYLDIDDYACNDEYSDMILFTKEKRGDTKQIEELAKVMEKYPFLFPYLIKYTYKTSDAKSIENELENTLLLAHKLNDDSKSIVWKTYGEIDKLHGLLKEQVTTANRTHTMVENVINKYALSIIPREEALPYFSDAKILVLGASCISIKDINEVVQEHGMDMDQFDFKLEYDKKEYFDLNKLKGNVNYKAVLIGPVPHKNLGKYAASSGIQEMKNRPDLYPRVIEVKNNQGELKITRSSFSEALNKLNSSK